MKKKIPYNDHDNKSNRFSTFLVTTTGILGALSLAVIIVLNVVNLTSILGQKGPEGIIMSQTEKLSSKLDQVNLEITGGINPKLSIINTATSYNLPNLITTQSKSIKDEIYKYCVPRVNNDVAPPQCENPTVQGHDSKFQMYDPNIILNCGQNLTKLGEINMFSFTPYASFIPSATTPGGCVRIPTFDIGNYIYSYSHNIMGESCTSAGLSSQYWSLGRISEGQDNSPTFKELVNWYLNDGHNRKSCTTAISGYGAWLICTVISNDLTGDYFNKGVGNIFVGYMDVYGTRKQWVIAPSQLHFENPMNSLYFSIGSGIVLGDSVYFLGYGASNVTLPGDAYCPAEDCRGKNTAQEICNRAQKPRWFGGNQIVQVVVSFEDSISKTPSIKVRTIPVTQYIIGAEGRLYKFPYYDKVFIYQRSSSWYGGIMFGELNLTGDLNIKWYKYTTFERPGSEPCTSSNRCPGECVTGVYTDMFLVALDGMLGISVELAGSKIRRAPTVMMADMTSIVFQKLVTTINQQAGYTTTTCFIYEYRPWCLSIVEMAPATVGQIQPVGLLYPIWTSCDRSVFRYPHDARPKQDSTNGNPDVKITPTSSSTPINKTTVTVTTIKSKV
ncbi:G protein [Bat paramyxovirus]|nr:G protein [Bat paramyxovirus]